MNSSERRAQEIIQIASNDIKYFFRSLKEQGRGGVTSRPDQGFPSTDDQSLYFVDGFLIEKNRRCF